MPSQTSDSADGDDLRTAAQQELDGLAADGLARELRTLSAAGPRAESGGRECIVLSSNDYLGLSTQPLVVSAAADAAGRYGAGAGASRLVTGNLPIHEELEAEIADLKGAEAAIVFSSGYAANLGLIPALVSSGDVTVCDKLNHASIIDACRLSGARLRAYRHVDMDRLEAILRREAGARRLLVVTDGVFSMDGDVAPLPDLVTLAERCGAWVVVDDAHGTGVLGPTGGGAVERFGLDAGALINMGTLSKAFGSQGGFVAGPAELIALLRNRARSFVYSTGLAPASAAAALAAIRLARDEPEIRERLWRNVRLLRQMIAGTGLAPVSTDAHITALVIGAVKDALAFADALLEAGVFAPAIRPPTVPRGTSRVRISVTAGHAREDVEGAAKAIRHAAEVVGS
ncbi:MAG: 8-amino-7-oxononanoate synthase [Armatimonadota bacterium]